MDQVYIGCAHLFLTRCPPQIQSFLSEKPSRVDAAIVDGISPLPQDPAALARSEGSAPPDDKEEADAEGVSQK